MKKFIVLWVVLICSSFVTFPTVAMHSKQKFLSHKLRCETCNKQFTRIDYRERHVLNTHCACPWCNNLEYLENVDFKDISSDDRQARLNHIKKCAQLQKNFSLWLCQKCFFFQRRDKEHKCGTKHQVNLISNDPINFDVMLNLEQETTCNKCPKQKKHRSITAFKNHILREHGICPCCSLQFTDDNKPLKNLSLQELEASIGHLIQCTQIKNESLFVCDTCLGVKLDDRVGRHFKKSCSGLFSKKTYTAQEAELFTLNKDLPLLSEIVQEHEKPVLSRLQDEDDNSVGSENCLVGDFFTEADFELNGSIEDSSLFTANSSADLRIACEMDTNNKCESKAKKNVRTRSLSTFRCEACDEQFTRVDSRVRHILNTHYACPWCNRLEYLKKGDFKNISSHDLQVRLNHLKQCAQLQKNSSLWLCLKCFDFRRLSKNHKCGEDYQVNLILNVPLNLDVMFNLELETTCNKCPKQKKHRSIEDFKNHMLREHGMCPCCSLQFTDDDKPLKNLSLQKLEASVDHLIQCIQLKNESLFGCDTCFGVKLGNKAGIHFKRSCKGLISEKIYTPQEVELLAFNPDSVSLNEILDEQLQESLNCSEKDASFLPKNNSTDLVRKSQDQPSLQDFFKIIEGDSVEPEGYPLGDINFKSDFILDSAVCSSLPSQIHTQSCDVSGHSFAS